jgi:CRP-like cAMP-binding protein
MEKEEYLRKLSSYHNLSIGFKAYLKFMLKESFFNRSDKICLSQTNLGGYCYLAKGSVRIYLYDEESEQEVTLLFFPFGNMLPDIKATIVHLKGTLYLDFLKDTVLYSIPEKHLGNVHKLFGESLILTATVTAETLARTIALLTDLKLMSADQRLEKLLENFPNVFGVASVKDVASYLGIHPTTLSAIRKKLNR